MGANNSTRRVSFESDDNENITVVKGIRLSENVINRMRDGGSSPLPQMKPPAAVTPPPPSTTYDPPPPPPLLRPIPPPFDPVTSMPAPPRVAAVAPPASEEKLRPLPPTPPPVEQPQVLPLPPAPAPEPAAPPQPRETPAALPAVAAPPAVGAPPVDEEALRKRIREELESGLEQERAKAEQELQAWLEAEQEAAAALAQADAQARVQQEVSRVLTEERALSRDGLHTAVLRERASADDEKLRAQRYAQCVSDPSLEGKPLWGWGVFLRLWGKRHKAEALVPVLSLVLHAGPQPDAFIRLRPWFQCCPWCSTQGRSLTPSSG
ncbi:unnamed protein product [Boreogadus saida]